MIRPILTFPDPRLRAPAKEVPAVTPAIQALVDDMAETMYAVKAIGLAATQIGEPHRIFVVDIDDGAGLRVCINPLLLAGGETQFYEEGCLSFPDVMEKVPSYASVHLHALDREGAGRTIEAEGLLAVALQHELDHLDGVLMIDRMGPLQRQLVLKKLAVRKKFDARKTRR